VVMVVVVIERSKGRVCPTTLPCYELVWDTYWGVLSGCVCVARWWVPFLFFFSFFFSFFFFNSLLLSGCADDEWEGCVSKCLFFISLFYLFLILFNFIYLFICLGKLADICGYSSFLLIDGWMGGCSNGSGNLG